MRDLRRHLPGIVATLLAIAIACSEHPTGPSPEGKPDAAGQSTGVLARVDGEPVYLEPTTRLLTAKDPKSRREWLEGAIARRLAAQEARRRGLDDSPEVRRKLDAIARRAQAAEETLLRDRLYASVRDGLEIPAQDLEARYQQTRGRYFERRLHLRRKSYASQAEAEAAAAALGTAGRLDAASSEAIGPLPVAELPRGVLPEALGLESPGERLLVEEAGTWSLVELVEILPAVPKPYADVQEKVDSDLRTLRGQEAFAALLAQLRAGARVEIDEAVLADEAVWKRLSEEARLIRESRH